jgi:hypothetical protein
MQASEQVCSHEESKIFQSDIGLASSRIDGYSNISQVKAIK